MSATNFFFTWNQALKKLKKTITDDYTAKTGDTGDNFHVDAVIDCADPAANLTLTVPDGYAVGQRLFITMSSNDDSKTLTITVTNGTDYTIATAGYQIELVWDGTNWVKCFGTTTS